MRTGTPGRSSPSPSPVRAPPPSSAAAPLSPCLSFRIFCHTACSAGIWHEIEGKNTLFGRPAKRRVLGLLRFLGNMHSHAGQAVQAQRFTDLDELYNFVLPPFMWIIKPIYDKLRELDVCMDALAMYYTGPSNTLLEKIPDLETFEEKKKPPTAAARREMADRVAARWPVKDKETKNSKKETKKEPADNTKAADKAKTPKARHTTTLPPPASHHDDTPPIGSLLALHTRQPVESA